MGRSANSDVATSFADYIMVISTHSWLLSSITVSVLPNEDLYVLVCACRLDTVCPAVATGYLTNSTIVS